ncbi:MAG: hypothetical protein HY682_01520 [Chloroflexi bacterium]|nr:hypothetical protein [Chloroflexota bacterium]
MTRTLGKGCITGAAVAFAAVFIACGGGRSDYIPPTSQPAPRVELEAIASVTVLEGQQVTREIRELTALPRELSLRPNRTVRLLAAAFDQNGRPIETGIEYQWKVEDARAGTIEPATSPNSPPLFRASSQVGDYPQALIVSAFITTPSGVSGTS